MATGEVKEAGTELISRITDIAEEPLEFLLPIAGYEDMPLVSLETAVEQIIHLLPLVQTYAFVAKERCKNPADGLTQDESAAIMLYTMGWKPRDKCLYVVLNATLRDKDREKLTPWFLYLRLLLNALCQLPNISRTVFRGIKLNLSEQYVIGNTIVWWGFSSCTNKINVLQSDVFLGKTDMRTMFTIECLNGKDIRKHSYYSKEDEILLLPAAHFKVIGCLNQDNLDIIHLQQIQPQYPFLQQITIQTEQFHLTVNINDKTRWRQHGLIIAGGHGSGSQLNQLCCPHGIYIDDKNQIIYIADYENDRVVKWRFDAENGEVIAGGNEKGNGIDQLNCPTDVVLDKQNDSLIVCDNGNRRVVRWSLRNGVNQQIIISNIDCTALAIDNNGDLYVCDCEKNEVRRWRTGKTSGTIVAGGNGEGDRLDQLHSPRNIFVDRNHSVYVSDRKNHRVMKWIKDAKEGIVVAGGCGKGNSLTQFSHAQGIIVDHLDNIYVADSRNNRIMLWLKGSQEGRIIIGGNGEGKRPNQFNGIRGLSCDRQGNFYISDLFNNRVQKFDIHVD